MCRTVMQRGPKALPASIEDDTQVGDWELKSGQSEEIARLIHA
jgi:hypothetical protein